MQGRASASSPLPKLLFAFGTGDELFLLANPKQLHVQRLTTVHWDQVSAVEFQMLPGVGVETFRALQRLHAGVSPALLACSQTLWNALKVALIRCIVH